MDHHHQQQKFYSDAQEEQAGEVELHNNDVDDYVVLDDGNNLDLGNLRKRKGKIIASAKETIENASRLIRRRVPAAGHFMTPRRLWLNKIPTQCDVVLEFPDGSPDEALRWLLNRIRSPKPDGLGLQSLVRAHESTKRTAFYISAPTNVLFKAAEEYRLPKRLRSDLGGALRDFTTRESHCFEQIKDDDGKISLFTSQERQWLVLQVLQGLRANSSDMAMLQGKAQVDEGQSIVAAWQESGLILQVFPLHETNALTQLKTSWVRKFFAPQPLDDIASYFGVKVALYFAWLGHYTCALCVPAILGTLLWAGLYGRGQTAQDIGHVLFSLFNVAWASLYLEAWRRYSVELAFRWGTLSTPPELLEPPRPLYKGPLEESPVTGRLEPQESPAWKRRAFRYLVSFPIIGLCLALVFVVMFLMLRLQDWWDSKLPEDGLISCLSVIPKVMLAGAITLMDEFYYKLAVWLNDKENYREQSKYDNHLIAKVALFQFVNSFLSLFYIAFYLRDQEKLKEQLAGLLISRQIIGNLRESAYPYIMEQWRLATLSFKMYGAMTPTKEMLPSIDDEKKPETEPIVPPIDRPSTPKRSIGQAEIESSFYKYDGTFSDHLEMLVQMGYVVLFSSAFPLAGLCALANNLLEIRSDAFKLAHVHQRPFGQRVANIGTWQNALGLLGLAAVIVNCALIGLSGQVSRLWPGLTQTQTVVLIVALEHIMLGLRSALTWILPELPSWLAAEIARAEHCRREMQCKGSSPRATPPSPPSSTSMSHEHSTPDMFDKSEPLISQDAEDIVFERMTPGSPKRFEDTHHRDPFAHLRSHRSSTEHDNFIHYRDDGTPDSPISQTSTVLCLRPLHESSTGQSVHNIPLDTAQNNSGACKSKFVKSLKNKIPEIPTFRGHSVVVANNMYNKLVDTIKKSTTGSTTSSSTPAIATARAISQPVPIPEIPPFRKNDHQGSYSPPINHPSSIIHTGEGSPPSIAEIPPFKPRKSKDYIPDTELSHVEHHLTIGPSGGAEWARRLKVAEPSPIHRSTDCIVSKQELATSSDSELLKPAPSWTNVALKSADHTASTSSNVSVSAPSVPKATTAEEEQRLAEVAAKKSRLKQKLVKSARSVAIFSLKLKERRAREAERIRQEKAEELAQEILMSSPGMCGGGGELNLIPLEQLIHIEDVVSRRPSGSQNNSNIQGSGI
ncbi:unnamed protein product [Diamesa hyperborea]